MFSGRGVSVRGALFVFLLVLVAFIGAPVWAAPPVIVYENDFAGKWGSSGSGDGQFTLPHGIALDSAGNVFVVEVSNARVQKFDADGQFISKFGAFGAGDGQFFSPSGVAINSSDEIYVVDFSASANRVQQFDANGTFIRKWGTGGSANGEFQNPRSLAVGPGGDVHVSDFGNDRIQVFEADGTFLRIIGSTGSGDGQLSFPDGIAVDGSGNVFVADQGNHRVQVFDSSGVFVRAWGSQGSGDGQFDSPSGLALGSDGIVYVADFNNDRVQVFTTAGVFLGKWGTAGNGDGEFQGPTGLVATASGRVYVTNFDGGIGNRVQYFEPIWNVTMDEDGDPTPFSLTLSAFDADADTITWSISSGAPNGTADASGTGSSKAISYTPNVDFNGADNFDVQIDDGNAGTATRTVYVTINPINDGPVIDQAGPLQVTMSQDGNPTPFVAPVVTATDPEGDTITWSVSSAATNGTATVSGSGLLPTTFAYTPTAGYTGTDAFTIQASDGSLSDTVVVEVTIEATAEAPVIDQGPGPLMVEMDEDGTFTAPALSATDGDTQAGDLTWSVSMLASFGFADVSGSGASPTTFTYTPATDYDGADSFTIEVSDGVLTDSIVVNVTINPLNDAPVIFQGAGPLSVTMSEDGNPTDFARPTLYATDVDGDTLTWSVASPATNGTAEVSGSGSSATVLDYTPDADFAGSDSFTVQVSDGTLSDTIVIQVTVEGTDDAPVIDQGAGPLEVTMDEDGTFTAPALSATDPDEGATLTWSLNAPPASGTATISGTGTSPTTFNYAPNADFNGSDAFMVQVSDGTTFAVIAVHVTVTPVNDLPVIDQGAGPLTVTMSEDGAPTAFVAPEVSATDVDGDTLAWSVAVQPANGAATAHGTGASPTEITFTPDADFAGTDSFVVRVSDGEATDAITIEVTLEPVNDAPAIDQGDGPVIAGYNQGGDTPGFYSGPLSASDVDNDAAELTWTLLTPPAEGTAEVSGSGASPTTYTYSVGEEFLGADSFVVQVSDGEFTDTITVEVSVNDGNDRPVITQGDDPLVVEMDEDGAPTAFIAPAIDATDSDGNTLTWSLLSQAANGAAVVSGEGPSPTTLTYTPNADFNGADSFTVQVSDGFGGTDEIVVSVTVHPVNDPAVITQGDGPLAVTMAEDGDFTAPELSATDIDSDTLTWSVAKQATSGVATVSGDGSSPAVFGYVPNGDFNGADSFEVLVSDDEGGSDSIVIDVTVTPVNDAPTIAEGNAVVVTMSEDGSPTAFAAPTVTATDADGDSLSWSLGVAAEHGTATATGDGASPSITYTPEANYFGVDGFTVEVSDGNGGTDMIVIVVTVNPTNDDPEIAQGDGPLAVTMEEDGEFTAPEISATDIDGDTLTWSIGTAASHGLAFASGTGASPDSVTYVPVPDYSGTDSFTIVVSDNNGGTDDITIEVTVTPVQDAPVIEQGESVSVTMSEDGSPTAFTAPTITALEVDGDTLTWSLSTEAAHGTATVTGTGVSPTVTYAPEANYFGSDSFTVEVSDGNGGTDTLTVNITIEAVSDGITITQGESVSVTMSENGTPTPFVAPTIEATGLESEFENWVWTISSTPSHGTATASGTGTSPATLTYRPERNFDGEDMFTIQVSDGIGGLDQIVVTVTVENVNNVPELISSDFELKGKWSILSPEGETKLTRMPLAIGPNNELYVGENSHIRIYNADGELQRTLAEFPADSLAVDESGAVYALTHSPLTFKKFSANGEEDMTWSVDPTIFPVGRIHSASTISVTADGLARFVHFEKPYPISTTTIRLHGLGFTGTLNHSAVLPIYYHTRSFLPWFSALDSSPTNTNYVATIDGAGISYVRRQNHDPFDVASPYYPVTETVGVYNATGTKLREFRVPSVSSGGKRHIAVTQDGQELFLSESDRGKVEVVTGTGARLTTFGRAGSADGEFTTISGLAVNGEARVYVSDTSAGRIQYFERTPIEGIVHTTMKEEGSFALPVIVVDGDGDTITWAVISGPEQGEGVVTGGAAVNYIPPVNFNGETSFVVAAQDGMGGSTEVEVRVTVEPVDDPPVITQGDRAISVLMSRNGSPVPFRAPRLSATDPDGDTLTWSLETTWSSIVGYWVEYTIRTLGTPAGSATGPEFADYSFIPAQNFTGNDSFIVRVTDPKGLSDTIQINIGISSGSTSTTTGHFAQMLKENFDQFDINDDGSISRNEFIQAFPEASETSFEELDTNGDGFLSQEEVDAGEVPFVGMGCVYPSEMKSISESIVGKVLEAVGGSLLPFISLR